MPAFNISDYAMFLGIFEISEEKNAPLIVGIHPDEVQHIGVEMIAAVTQRAHRSSVPIAIHWDHGANYEQILTAIHSRLHVGDDRRLDAAVRRKHRHLQEGGPCRARCRTLRGG